jgi:DNA-directed RNA polymerase specialized sigma24 family protein
MAERPPEVERVEAALVELRRRPDDEAAWATFYRYFRRQVAGQLFLAGVRRQDDVAELCQVVFTKFLEYSPWKDDWRTLPSRGRIAAYLRRVAESVRADYFTSRRAEPEVLLDELDNRAIETAGLTVPGAPTPSPAALRERLSGLSDDERRLLGMVIRGVPPKEIARQLRITYTAAGVRVHRLKARVRELLRV